MEYTVVLDGGRPWGVRLSAYSNNNLSNQIIVAKVSASSEAAERGLEAGDVVHAINGVSTAGLTEAEAVQLLRTADHRLVLQLVKRPSEPTAAGRSRTQLSSGNQLQLEPVQVQQYYSDDGASTSDSQGSIIQVINGRRRLVSSPITTTTTTTASNNNNNNNTERRSSLTNSNNGQKKVSKQVTFSLPSTTSTSDPATSKRTTYSSPPSAVGTVFTDNSSRQQQQQQQQEQAAAADAGSSMSYLAPPSVHFSRIHSRDKVLTPFRPRSPSRDLTATNTQFTSSSNDVTGRPVSPSQFQTPAVTSQPPVRFTDGSPSTVTSPVATASTSWRSDVHGKPPQQPSTVQMTSQVPGSSPRMTSTNVVEQRNAVTSSGPVNMTSLSSTSLPFSGRQQQQQQQQQQQPPQIPIIVENYDTVPPRSRSSTEAAGRSISINATSSVTSSAPAMSSSRPLSPPIAVEMSSVQRGGTAQTQQQQQQQRPSSAGSPAVRRNIKDMVVWPPPKTTETMAVDETRWQTSVSNSQPTPAAAAAADNNIARQSNYRVPQLYTGPLTHAAVSEWQSRTASSVEPNSSAQLAGNVTSSMTSPSMPSRPFSPPVVGNKSVSIQLSNRSFSPPAVESNTVHTMSAHTPGGMQPTPGGSQPTPAVSSTSTSRPFSPPTTSQRTSSDVEQRRPYSAGAASTISSGQGRQTGVMTSGSAYHQTVSPAAQQSVDSNVNSSRPFSPPTYQAVVRDPAAYTTNQPPVSASSMAATQHVVMNQNEQRSTNQPWATSIPAVSTSSGAASPHAAVYRPFSPSIAAGIRPSQASTSSQPPQGGATDAQNSANRPFSPVSDGQKPWTNSVQTSTSSTPTAAVYRPFSPNPALAQNPASRPFSPPVSGTTSNVLESSGEARPFSPGLERRPFSPTVEGLVGYRPVTAPGQGRTVAVPTNSSAENNVQTSQHPFSPSSPAQGPGAIQQSTNRPFSPPVGAVQFSNNNQPGRQAFSPPPAERLQVGQNSAASDVQSPVITTANQYQQQQQQQPAGRSWNNEHRGPAGQSGTVIQSGVTAPVSSNGRQFINGCNVNAQQPVQSSTSFNNPDQLPVTHQRPVFSQQVPPAVSPQTTNVTSHQLTHQQQRPVTPAGRMNSSFPVPDVTSQAQVVDVNTPANRSLYHQRGPVSDDTVRPLGPSPLPMGRPGYQQQQQQSFPVNQNLSGSYRNQQLTSSNQTPILSQQINSAVPELATSRPMQDTHQFGFTSSTPFQQPADVSRANMNRPFSPPATPVAPPAGMAGVVVAEFYRQPELEDSNNHNNIQSVRYKAGQTPIPAHASRQNFTPQATDNRLVGQQIPQQQQQEQQQQQQYGQSTTVNYPYLQQAPSTPSSTGRQDFISRPLVAPTTPAATPGSTASYGNQQQHLSQSQQSQSIAAPMLNNNYYTGTQQQQQQQYVQPTTDTSLQQAPSTGRQDFTFSPPSLPVAPPGPTMSYHNQQQQQLSQSQPTAAPVMNSNYYTGNQQQTQYSSVASGSNSASMYGSNPTQPSVIRGDYPPQVDSRQMQQSAASFAQSRVSVSRSVPDTARFNAPVSSSFSGPTVTTPINQGGVDLARPVRCSNADLVSNDSLGNRNDGSPSSNLTGRPLNIPPTEPRPVTPTGNSSIDSQLTSTRSQPFPVTEQTYNTATSRNVASMPRPASAVPFIPGYRSVMSPTFGASSNQSAYRPFSPQPTGRSFQPDSQSTMSTQFRTGDIGFGSRQQQQQQQQSVIGGIPAQQTFPPSAVSVPVQHIESAGTSSAAARPWTPSSQRPFSPAGNVHPGSNTFSPGPSANLDVVSPSHPSIPTIDHTTNSTPLSRPTTPFTSTPAAPTSSQRPFSPGLEGYRPVAFSPQVSATPASSDLSRTPKWGSVPLDPAVNATGSTMTDPRRPEDSQTAAASSRLTFGPRRASDASSSSLSPRDQSSSLPRSVPSSVHQPQYTPLAGLKENIVLGSKEDNSKQVPVGWKQTMTNGRSSSLEPPTAARNDSENNSTSTVLRLFGDGKTLDSIGTYPAAGVADRPEIVRNGSGNGRALPVNGNTVTPPWNSGPRPVPDGRDQFVETRDGRQTEMWKNREQSQPGKQNVSTSQEYDNSLQSRLLSPTFDDSQQQQQQHNTTTNGPTTARDLYNRQGARDASRYPSTLPRSSRSNSADSKVDTKKVESKFGKPTLFYGGIGPKDEQTGVPIALRNTITDRHKKEWYKQMYSVLHKVPDQDGEERPLSPANNQSTTNSDRLLRQHSNPGRIEDYVPGQSRAAKATATQKHRSIRLNVESDTEAEYRRRDVISRDVINRSVSPARSDQAVELQQRRGPANPHAAYRSWTLNRPATTGRMHDRQISEPSTNIYNRYDALDDYDDSTLTRASTLDSRRRLTNTSKINTNNDFSNFRVNGGSQFNDFHSNSQPSRPYTTNTSSVNPFDENYWMRLISDDDSSRDDRSSQYASSVSSRDSDARSLQRPVNSRPTDIYGKARALYSFRAQNPRELSFKRDDVIHLIKQIDKNWYEGRLHGVVGILPANYIQIVTSLEDARCIATTREGQGRAKYNFTGQTQLELSFRKGDSLRLIRQVDSNWYEGRLSSGGRSGIFPINYVDTLVEPQSQLMTPMSSLAPSPLPGGSPGQLSPVSSISGPTRPSAPMSPAELDQLDVSDVEFDFNTATTPYYNNNYNNSGSNRGGGGLGTSTGGVMGGNGLGNRQRSQSAMDYHQPQLYQQNKRPGTLDLSDPQRVLDELNEKLKLGTKSLLDNTNTSRRSQQQQPTTTTMTLQSHSRGGATDDRLLMMKNLGVLSAAVDVVGPPPQVNSRHVNGDATNGTPHPLYRAVYDYKPRNDDELALRENDIVEVMERCDDGWFVGMSRSSNEFGTFPGNYVQKI